MPRPDCGPAWSLDLVVCLAAAEEGRVLLQIWRMLCVGQAGLSEWHSVSAVAVALIETAPRRVAAPKQTATPHITLRGAPLAGGSGARRWTGAVLSG